MDSAFDDLFGTPTAPEFRVDWLALSERFQWIRAMRGVEQDAVWHAEGDVWIHSRMVCEQLAQMGAFRALDPEAQRRCWLAALMHDIAKPYCTRQEDGRVRSPHHSPKGAVHARQVLWQAGYPSEEREAVCGLIRHHQLPFYAVLETDNERRVTAASMRCRLQELAVLAEADMRGRTCPDKQEKLDSLLVFSEWGRELGCWDRPRSFANDHTRVLYFRGKRAAADHAFDDTVSTVTVMSGLPASGKSTWRRKHRPDLPVVCLDEIRDELGVHPEEDQGRVRQAAVARAKEFLRASQGFVWDATNLDRDRRRKIAELCFDYKARVEFVTLEVSFERQDKDNSARKRPVPPNVIASMLRHWVPPDLTEAHEIQTVERGAE